MPSLKVAALAVLAATAQALPSNVLRRQENAAAPTGNTSAPPPATGNPSESAVPSGSSTEKAAGNATAAPPAAAAPPPAAAAAAGGLTDPDILQFALTLEHLESNFYQQGFARFQDRDFEALGLKPDQVRDLKFIGTTEQLHVSFLQSALAQGGVQPVQPCEYDFKFTDAKSMATTAALIENVGVSAYAGAAKFISDKKTLEAAATILPVEARHQSSLRLLLGQNFIPQGFDAPLGPRHVFTMAAPFIKSCPQGSNLAIQAFPSLAMETQTNEVPQAGQTIKVRAASGANGATNCGFTSGGVSPGGTAFSKFTEAEGCKLPPGLSGVTYMTLVNSAPLDGVLTDEITVAGPMILSL